MLRKSASGYPAQFSERGKRSGHIHLLAKSKNSESFKLVAVFNGSKQIKSEKLNDLGMPQLNYGEMIGYGNGGTGGSIGDSRLKDMRDSSSFESPLGLAEKFKEMPAGSILTIVTVRSKSYVRLRNSFPKVIFEVF